MSKNKIIITVEGGIIQSVCATDPKLEIVVIDYDNDDEDKVFKYEPDYIFKEGEGYKVLLGNLNGVEKLVREELKEMNV